MDDTGKPVKAPAANAGTGGPAGAGRPPLGPWPSVLWTLVLAIALIAAQIALAYGLYRIVPAPSPRAMPMEELSANNGFYFFLAALVTTPALLGALLRLTRGRGRCARDYLALERPGGKDLAVWIAVGLATVVLLVGIELTDRPSLLLVHFNWLLTTSPGMWPSILYLAVLGPIAEEALFRGFLHRGLARSRVGEAGAAVVGAVLWAGIQYDYGLASLVGLLGIGLALGAARASTGSVIVPLAMRAANALFLTVFILLRR